jgi:hypothetical protein
MIITSHWSGSGAVRLRAYHEEIARTGAITDTYRAHLRTLWSQMNGALSVDWPQLFSLFTVWKNTDLSTPRDYGTWDINTDPRDGSTNIEIASMCMPGGATAFDGAEPFTVAHAFVHAYLVAAIAKRENIDVLATFPASVRPGTLQNGPIDVVGTHGTRAIQTIDYGVSGGNAASQAQSDEFGYFFGSGDPDSRADLFCLDPAWYDGTVTIAQAKASAQQLRWHAHVIKVAECPAGMLGVDEPESP